MCGRDPSTSGVQFLVVLGAAYFFITGDCNGGRSIFRGSCCWRGVFQHRIRGTSNKIPIPKIYLGRILGTQNSIGCCGVGRRQLQAFQPSC